MGEKKGIKNKPKTFFLFFQFFNPKIVFEVEQIDLK